MNDNSFESLNDLLDQCLELFLRQDFEGLDLALDKLAYMVRLGSFTLSKEEIDKLQVKVSNLVELISATKEGVKRDLMSVQNRIRTILRFNSEED